MNYKCSNNLSYLFNCTRDVKIHVAAVAFIADEFPIFATNNAFILILTPKWHDNKTKWVFVMFFVSPNCR